MLENSMLPYSELRVLQLLQIAILDETLQVRGSWRGGSDSGVRHRHRPGGRRVLQGRRPRRQLLRQAVLTLAKGD